MLIKTQVTASHHTPTDAHAHAQAQDDADADARLYGGFGDQVVALLISDQGPDE